MASRHMKQCKFSSYQGNTNQKHNEVPPDSSEKGHHYRNQETINSGMNVGENIS